MDVKENLETSQTKDIPLSFFRPNLSREYIEGTLNTQENILKYLKQLGLYRTPPNKDVVDNSLGLIIKNDMNGKLTILSLNLERNVKSLKDDLEQLTTSNNEKVALIEEPERPKLESVKEDYNPFGLIKEILQKKSREIE